MRSKDHPNMLGASIFALVLGTLLMGLAFAAKFRGEAVEANGVILGAALLLGAALAYEKHRELAAMSPEERDRYWAAKEAEWQEIADARARAELGDDYRPVRKDEER